LIASKNVHSVIVSEIGKRNQKERKVKEKKGKEREGRRKKMGVAKICFQCSDFLILSSFPSCRAPSLVSMYT
jgi:hypothetical protein